MAYDENFDIVSSLKSQYKQIYGKEINKIKEYSKDFNPINYTNNITDIVTSSLESIKTNQKIYPSEYDSDDDIFGDFRNGDICGKCCANNCKKNNIRLKIKETNGYLVKYCLCDDRL